MRQVADLEEAFSSFISSYYVPRSLLSHSSLYRAQIERTGGKNIFEMRREKSRKNLLIEEERTNWTELTLHGGKN